MAEPYSIQLQQAVAAALDGATLVTANTRASRYLLRQCDRRRLAIAPADRAWLTPAVLPLDAWLDELWRTAQVCGVLNLTLLGPDQQQLLWTRVVAGGAPSAAPASANRLARLAMEAWELVHACGIPLRPAEFSGTVEAASFFSWATAYGDHLAAKGWADPALEIDLLIPRISALKEYLPKRMIFAGFDTFTPQQRRLMLALESQSVALTVVKADISAEAAGLMPPAIKLADRADELRSAAAWARARLERDPAVQVGVVVAGLSGFRRQVEQVFSAILHPEQFFAVRDISQPAFDVSVGRPLADYPIIHSALTFLRLLQGPLPREEFSGWVRSPYFGALGEQACARAVLDQWLAGVLRPSVTLEAIIEAARKTQAGAAPGLIRQLRPASELARRAATPASAATASAGGRARRPGLWLEEISQVLATAGWPGEGSGISLGSEEYQAREAWEELLSEVGSLELVEPRMELGQVVEQLAEAAAGKIFKPQNQSAPVQVMGELEAAGSLFDALWIAGWSDQDWPSRHPPNPLLPRALQREYNVPHHSAAAELAFARAVTARLLASAPEVIVSWPAAEEDRQLRASPLITTVNATTAFAGDQAVPAGTMAGGSLKPASSEPGSRLPLASPKGIQELFPRTRLESVPDERAPRVAANELQSHGVRILEHQSNCPFRAFVEVRLLTWEQPSRETGLAASERGKLVERALQLVWEQLGDKYTLENCGEARLQEIVRRAVDQVLGELQPDPRQVPPSPADATLAPPDCWEARYFAVERERLCALLREWLDCERSREDFEVVCHQRDVQLELEGLPLHGRLDRLDRLRDGSLVIIDYKTGQQQLGPGQWRTPRPVHPQLPSYAVALQPPSAVAANATTVSTIGPVAAIAGVAFALVKRGSCGMAGIAERPEILGKKKAARGPGLRESLASWRPELESLARDFMNGEARVAPKRASTCDETYCRLHAVCRMAEIDFPPSQQTQPGLAAEALEEQDDASE